MVRVLLPDAMMIDLMMPILDGWQLIERCRADPATARLPIIAVSAKHGGQTASTPGMQAFLSKPFDLDRLLEVLVDVVGQETLATSTVP